MIYVNTAIPIEELSKIQEHYTKGRRIKIRDEWIDKNRDVLYEKHSEWSKNNKDIIANYREENRDRIKEQYKKFKSKQVA